MMIATLVAVLLTGQGWWYAGSTQSVQIKAVLPAALDEVQDPRVRVTLKLGEAVLHQSTRPWPEGQADWDWPIEVPEVDQPVRMRVIWSLLGGPGSRVISRGAEDVFVIPRDQVLKPLRELALREALHVVDRDGGFAAALDRLEIKHKRYGRADQLPMRPGLVVVAPDTWRGEPFEQGALRRVRPGGVLVLRQNHEELRQISGVALSRSPGTGLVHTAGGHVVVTRMSRVLGLAEMDAGDVLWSASGSEPWQPGFAVKPVKGIGADMLVWQSAAKDPATVERVYALAMQRDGVPVILFQLPLGSVNHDPRSASVLYSMLTFLSQAPRADQHPEQAAKDRNSK